MSARKSKFAEVSRTI